MAGGVSVESGWQVMVLPSGRDGNPLYDSEHGWTDSHRGALRPEQQDRIAESYRCSGSTPAKIEILFSFKVTGPSQNPGSRTANHMYSRRLASMPNELEAVNSRWTHTGSPTQQIRKDSCSVSP